MQESQEGLGHAVYQAKKEIDSEPFLLMLGDHLYQSKRYHDNKSCVQQLLDAYRGVNLLGLKVTHESEITNYGAVRGTWMTDDQTQQDSYEIAENQTNAINSSSFLQQIQQTNLQPVSHIHVECCL